MEIINIHINRVMERKIRIVDAWNQIYPHDELFNLYRYCEIEVNGERKGQDRTGQNNREFNVIR